MRMDEGMAETASACALIIAFQMKRRRRRRRNTFIIWTREWILQCERLHDHEHEDVHAAVHDSGNRYMHEKFR